MKHTLTLLALCFLFGCTQPAPQKPTTNHEPMIREYFAQFNKHEWEKLAQMYIENAEFKDPSLGQTVVKQTRAQFVQKYTELSKTFPAIKDEIKHIYPSGEKNIIVEFVSSGTAPDGSKFELPICTIFTIENGLITKDYTYYDNSQE